MIRFLLLVLTFVAQPAFAASSPSLGSLEQQLSGLIAERSGDVGIAAVDLSSGTGISIHGDDAFPMASTVKVAVAATYLSQVDYGRRSLNDSIRGVPAASLMERMLIHSDNQATDMLLSDLGGPRAVQQWLRFHGFTDLRIDRTIAQLLRDKRDLRDERDSSTPLAMVNLLRRIDNGELLKSASRSYLLQLMSRCETGKNRIRALLPFGTKVEHKTGTLTGVTDDVGFITLPDGRRIAVAVFARGGSDRARTIAEAARAIYDGFTSVLRWPFGSALTTQ